MFIIILKDISVFLLNNKLKREYKIMLIKIRGGNMKRDFFEKWSFILNLILFCAFLFLVVLMFYKDVDLIYIFCTLLISLLPLLNIIKDIRKRRIINPSFFYEKNRLGNKSMFYDLRSYIGSN